MLTRLRSSRGWGKFRRNTGAMVAVAVIGLYVLLGLWVWSMEGIRAVGRQTGWWDISDHRVMGLLLPERTLERVGPPTLAGFGMTQDSARRTDQADAMLNFIREAVSTKADAEASGQTLGRAALASTRLAERRLADVPNEQRNAWLSEADAMFARIDAAKRRQNLLATLRVNTAKVRTLAVAAAAADASRLDAARGDLAAAVEEIDFTIEDYTKLAAATASISAPADPLLAFDLTPVRDAADLLLSDRTLTPAEIAAAAPLPALDALESLLTQGAARIDAEISTSTADVEAVVLKLMPIPDGLDGVLYRAKVLLGTDKQGRSILIRGLYSAKVAMQVGTVVALISVLLGAILGSAAAYFGGRVDHAVTWLYSTLSSLPQLVLLAVLTFMFLGSQFEKTLIPIYVAFCLTFWIGPCRVIRGEVLKIKELEYAQAATSIGFGRWYILRKHVLPNTLHLMFINFSLLFIGAIKSEVILTFLGLGIKEGSSWGIMISQSQPEVITGFFWQIGAATFFMLVLVQAFNTLSDALQDAFDPKAV